MCLVFTCGDTEFSRKLKGYESVVCRCYNCGNYSASVIKRNPWFTFCFVPVLPLSIHGYEDVVCSICRFAQPLSSRPDLIGQRDGQGGVTLQTYPPQPGPSNASGGPPQLKPGMQYG
ncbi:hypothetical protein K3495_g8854 [Podosphaera aphanis]|nr:hypothetical protein K3495_g8854 [Podosphaera aphanis]